MQMLFTLILLLSLVVFSSVLQKNYKIPSPLTLIGLVLVASSFGLKPFDFTSPQFDMLVLITLPVLIATDAMKLHWDDLKTHGLSLFWVAVISVLLSVGAGVLINGFVLVDYPLSIAAVTILFAMVSATDPVTVSAIFSNFKVPHKLKVLTEGESLFNDATALIVFSIALVALQSPEKVTLGFIAEKSFSVIFGAISIGLLMGFITVRLLKVSDDALIETAIIVLSAYTSYWITEYFHFSGILAVIVTIVIVAKYIKELIESAEEKVTEATKKRNFNLLKYSVTSKDNHVTILKNMDFISLFAAATLFIAIGATADFGKMMEHWYEILAVFIASTVIRAIMMFKFALVSNKVRRMQTVYKHWWTVLTFAGSKGALSILMVHMLPGSFEYKDLFKTIIIGNIILSTFVYALILAFVITKNKTKFEQECAEDIH